MKRIRGKYIVKQCYCGKLKRGRVKINHDAVNCRNCHGWMSGIRLFAEGQKK